MALTTTAGMAVYLMTYHLHAKRLSDDSMAEIKDATGNLFRVVGWLFILLLSLTFTSSTLAQTRPGFGRDNRIDMIVGV